MFRKILVGLLASCFGYVLPALGNIDVLHYPHIWILVTVGVLGSIFQPVYKPLDNNAPVHDKGTATQIVWTVYLTQMAGVIEAVYFRFPESFVFDKISLMAIAMIALGFGIRTWAVRELGKFFTWHITVQSDQKVVKTGPYRFMRHPSYTGGLLMYVFTSLVIHAWYAAIASFFLLLFAFVRRVKHEEVWMSENMGDEYKNYKMKQNPL